MGSQRAQEKKRIRGEASPNSMNEDADASGDAEGPALDREQTDALAKELENDIDARMDEPFNETELTRQRVEGEIEAKAAGRSVAYDGNVPHTPSNFPAHLMRAVSKVSAAADRCR